MGQGDKSERTDNSNNRQYSIMPMVDFNKIVLPNFMSDMSGSMDNKLPLCPPDYIDQLQMRIATFAMVQAKIKKANLSSE